MAMHEYLSLNLINVFTFYLWAAFFLSMCRRLSQYRDFAQLAVNMPNRWPKVLRNMQKHGVLFMTWATIRPAGVALVLICLQMICSKVIWPRAIINGHDLLSEWWVLPILGLCALLMVSVDGYGIFRVGKIDRKETEKYLDEAEHWLSSWKAPLIQTVTFGYINPRVMVDTEVRKAMEQGNTLLQSTFWWMSLQSGVRLLFGICLWTCWAML
ncbi:hypothetical protein KIH39_05390 [Telmatocola sphagniphila]|uniref:Uncharacterized protein n=1 Tax=Telmatocola sphagniphila TaxID=1123043 RepID=A0A8E6BA39_9BACT|nr:hypothetical protein [Telmatocola sphagniphila]QVL33348.1 hypothetical protein KIH39_05390 [Telmatocola sphagniphila]